MRHSLLRATTVCGISLLTASCSSSSTHPSDAGGIVPGDSGKDSAVSHPDAGSRTDGGSGKDAGSKSDAGSKGDAGSADAGSKGDGGSTATDWSCLGSQGSASGSSITYTITFVDRTTGAGAANLPVVLCSTGTLLTDCNAADTNVDAVFATATTDANGKATLTVDLAAHNLNSDGVSGFVYLVDSTHAIYDQQVFVSFVENQNLVVRTMTPAQAMTIATALNVTLDMVNGGILGGEVIDCNYKPAAGATVTNNQAETVAYFSGGAASSSATATDATGEYIVLNAQFASTGVQWSNAAAAAVGGLTVAPSSGMVTTIAIPHTH